MSHPLLPSRRVAPALVCAVAVMIAPSARGAPGAPAGPSSADELLQDAGLEPVAYRELLARLEVAHSLQPVQLATVHLLDTVARVTPEGVVVSSVHVEGPAVTLEAVARDDAARDGFALTLCSTGVLTGCAVQERDGGAFTVRARESLPAPVAGPGLPTDRASAIALREGLEALIKEAVRTLPECDPTDIATLVTAQGRKSGANRLTADVGTTTWMGGLGLLPVHVTGVATFGEVGWLTNGLSRLRQSHYWARLSLTQAPPLVGLPESPVARQQALYLAGRKDGETYVAVDGTLMWGCFDESRGPVASPAGLAYEVGPAYAADYAYSPFGQRDPFAAPPGPQPAEAPGLPLEPGAFRVHDVPLPAALMLAAYAAETELRAAGMPETTVTADASYGTVDATFAELLRGSGLAVTHRRARLTVAPPGVHASAAPWQTSWPVVIAETPTLQAAELDGFWLVGIADGSRPAAMLADASGGFHVIQVGTYVGRNWGKVSAIYGDRVDVLEEFQTVDGEIVQNTITLKMMPAAPR